MKGFITMKTTCEYVAFASLMLITGTGLALIVIGACLLSWAAYMSPWLPTWVFLSMAGFTVLGVAVAATSATAAVATIAPKPQAAHKCLVLLLICLGLEIGLSSMGALQQKQWSVQLYHDVQGLMTDSLNVYSTNDSSAAMWNEIQTEMSCCGVKDYSDWFRSGLGDGLSVPDSCCLLPSPGCGVDVKKLDDVSDQIDITGCLPVLSAGWSHTYRVLVRQGMLPICVIQVLMVLVIVLTYRRAGLLNGHVPLRVATIPISAATRPAASGESKYTLMP